MAPYRPGATKKGRKRNKWEVRGCLRVYAVVFLSLQRPWPNLVAMIDVFLPFSGVSGSWCRAGRMMANKNGHPGNQDGRLGCRRSASCYLPLFKAVLEFALEGNRKPKINNADDIIERLLPELSNLYQIYNKGNIIQKHTLIRGVFKDKLAWGEEMFRTAFIDPTFYDNILKVKEKGLPFWSNPFENRT